MPQPLLGWRQPAQFLHPLHLLCARLNGFLGLIRFPIHRLGVNTLGPLVTLTRPCLLNVLRVHLVLVQSSHIEPIPSHHDHHPALPCPQLELTHAVRESGTWFSGVIVLVYITDGELTYSNYHCTNVILCFYRNEASPLVSNFPDAIWKSYQTREEAESHFQARQNRHANMPWLSKLGFPLPLC